METSLITGGATPQRKVSAKPGNGRELASSAAALAFGPISLEVEIVLVTSAMAQAFLAKSINNRPVRARNVTFLVRQLQEEAWTFTGEPLIFDPDGFLLDGQHRCRACVASGIPFLALLVRGVQRAAFDRIDMGSKRTPADILAAQGVKQSNITAAAVAKLINAERSGEWWRNDGLDSPHDIGKAQPRFEGIDRYITLGREINNATYGPPSFWIVARYLAGSKDENLAQVFFSRLATGINLEHGSGETLLRQKLLEIRLSSGKLILHPKQLAALFVNAWNARRKGRHLRTLRGLVGDAPVPEMI